MTQTPRDYTFLLEKDEASAVDFLALQTGLPKQRIKDAMNKGAVWLTQKNKTLRIRRATKTLFKGNKLQLFYDARLLAKQAEEPTLILDQKRYSVWYKPHGLLSQGSQWGDHCSILRWIEVNLKRETFLVHRLDADAAGLILIAHDSDTTAKLSGMFQSRNMHKTYQAWVEGHLDIPADGRLIDTDLDGKAAVTRVYELKKSLHNGKPVSLLKVEIETGRKHQIRRHLSAIGHPIIGDRLYGNAGEQLQLLAWQLEFYCPVTKRHQKIVSTQTGLLDLSLNFLSN
jgi:tRNA pseudouridine32 synthase/23S rRNA pseudouridine746 synthase